MKRKKIVLAITGASGAIYAKGLLAKFEAINDQIEELGLVMSENAPKVWKHELGDQSYLSYKAQRFHIADLTAPFASGSAQYDGMVICPCSMGTLGRIASGASNNLITRSADVMLKERRKLILVTRDTPLNLIHIRNMETITLAGGVVCPASPSFYSLPKTLDELADTVINRVLDLLDLEHPSYRWKGLHEE